MTSETSADAAPRPASSHSARRRRHAAAPGTTKVEALEYTSAPVEAADDTVVPDVAHLRALQPEALVLPHVEAPADDLAVEVPHPAPAADLPVVEAAQAAPADLPTSPVTLPARRPRAPRATAAQNVAEQLSSSTDAASTPSAFEHREFERLASGEEVDAADGPVAFAAAAADEDADAAQAVTDRANAEARAQEELDEFEAAARLFAFTGETPVQTAPARDADEGAVVAAQHPVDHAGRRRMVSFKRVATASFSVGVFGVVGLLAVGMTTPVSAVAAAQGVDAAATMSLVSGSDVEGDEEIQAYVAPADVQNGTLERSENYEALSLAEIAAESGIENFSSFFVNDPTAAIQWPFAVGVPITYGFGMRSGRMHEGADFVPGAGSPVQAVADGTVRIATESGGAFGVTVLIDHVIDGELVSSRYAHMQYDSLTVSAGDTVTVGTVIGKTGNTGRSFGAHTHFEILAGGTTPVDPISWLRAHTSG